MRRGTAVADAAGLVRPERAIAAYLALARACGASLRTTTAVRSWTAAGDGVTVTTDDGVIEGDRLILAPGAWAPELLRIDLPMRVRRRIQHFWRPADGTDFEPGRLPVWIWDWPPEQIGYGLPAVDGAVKAALHRGDETVDPDIGAADARPKEVARMRDWMEKRLPQLASAQWLGAKPCLYTLTPDEHFVLGAHPSAPNTWVAAGFSGHGFKFVPVIGEILADLALTGRTAYDIGIFDPTRAAVAVSGEGEPR